MLRVGAAYLAVAWLLIQVAQTVFPAFGLGADRCPQRHRVLAIGLLPALIFAWVFELTPEGLKRESEVDRSQSITPQTGKKLDRVIMGVLALALGYFAFDKFVLAPQREQAATEAARAEGRTEALVKSYGDKSIAVLPFVNMSADKDQEYFSDGISEELLNLLAKIPELRVIARTSSFSFKGKDVEHRARSRSELNVAHVLEGSVRKSGNKVRITAQLIEARSDTHLWSQTYDRQLTTSSRCRTRSPPRWSSNSRSSCSARRRRRKDVEPGGLRAVPAGARSCGRQYTPEGFRASPSRCTSRRSRSTPTTRRRGTGWPSSTSTRSSYGLRPIDEGYPAGARGSRPRRSRSTRTTRRPTPASAGSR